MITPGEPTMREKWRPRSSLTGFNAAVDRVSVATLKEGAAPTKRLARAVVDALGEELWRVVRETGRFHWPGVGVFYLARRKGRTVYRIGFRAGTGETMQLDATWKLAFRAARAKRGVGHGPV